MTCKQIKYTYQERIQWTQANRPAVYELIRDELEYPDRVVETMNFNDIPKGYEPPPVPVHVLSKRVVIGLDFLGAEAPGYPHQGILRTHDIHWVSVKKIGPVKTTYFFQLSTGEIIKHTIKGTIQNQVTQSLWRKYVLKEGGDSAGVRINPPTTK